MSGYTADDVLERLWNNEFDSESHENYREESGPHTGKKMARSTSERVKLMITTLNITKIVYTFVNIHTLSWLVHVVCTPYNSSFLFAFFFSTGKLYTVNRIASTQCLFIFW